MIQGRVTARPPEADRWDRDPEAAADAYLERRGIGDELGLSPEEAHREAVLDADLANAGCNVPLDAASRKLIRRAMEIFGGHVHAFEPREPDPEPARIDAERASSPSPASAAYAPTSESSSPPRGSNAIQEAGPAPSPVSADPTKNDARVGFGKATTNLWG